MIGDKSKLKVAIHESHFKITDRLPHLTPYSEEAIPLAKLSMIACIYKEKDYDVKEKHYKSHFT